MRGAKGQPSVGRAAILKEQGVVVVRGPSYNVRKVEEKEHIIKDDERSIQLQVEIPTTIDENFVDSDDVDENVDLNARPRKSTMSNATSSPLKQKVSNVKKTGITHSWIKGRKSRGKMSRRKLHILRSVSSSEQTSEDLHQQQMSIHHNHNLPSPPASDDLHASQNGDIISLDRHMDNTPQELLAPIMVPRMSGAFDRPPIAPSPTMSNDSWVTDTQRYDDVEGDTSTTFVPMSAVGKEKVIHKVNYPRPQTEEERAEAIDMFLNTTESTIANSHHSKRKSKPFLSGGDSFQSDVPTIEPPQPAPLLSPHCDRIDSSDALGSVPDQTMLSRQISLGVMSDDIQVIDSDMDEILSIPSPAARAAAKQRTQDFYSKPVNASGIIRKTSSTKRKTVSFHNASPTIIEPNVRAPSLSVPRGVMLAKETVTAELPEKLIPSLLNTRDSVKLTASRTESPQRQGSDNVSLASDDTFADRASKRMSTRVKDKKELRAASKRQSKAVAAALTDQIRGIPKSAMLAFSENEIELAESFDESDMDSSLSSLKRKSRQSKSVRMPEIVPGVVPRPPPPPPFSPETLRVRSIRKPPPPPTSPLRRQEDL